MNFTPSDELQTAEEGGDDASLEKLLERLVQEWRAAGGMVRTILSRSVPGGCIIAGSTSLTWENVQLLALSAIYTGIFGFQKSDTVLTISEAQGQVAAFGAIVSGLGVVSGGYLLFVYGTADAKRFQASGRVIPHRLCHCQTRC